MNLTPEELDKMVADANERLDADEKEEATDATDAQQEATPDASVEPLPAHEVDALGCLMRYFVNSRADIRNTFSVMLFTRQLYAVAMKDLELKFADIDDKQREKIVSLAFASEELVLPEGQTVDPLKLFDLLGEALSQTARAHGAQEFTERDLIPAMEKIVLPWFKTTLTAHIQREQNLNKARWEAMDKLRRARPVPLGVDYDEAAKDGLLRDKPLVLMGWTPAVRWVLDKIVEHVTEAADDQVYQVVRLATKNYTKDDFKEPSPRLTRVSGKDWKQCCKNNAEMDRLFTSKILPQLSDAPDLFVVDDLTHAAKASGLTVKSSSVDNTAKDAAEANKTLRTFIGKVGAGAVAGIPLGTTTLPDLGFATWRSLREFSYLRVVKVAERGDDYLLTIGETGWEALVPKSEIDALQVSNIILAR